jgi:hypothetical protein
MRSKLKVWAREFCVTGNLGVETYYNAKSDTPDTRILPIEDVIFDTTKTLKTSDVYYIRQYVTRDYVEKMMETEDGWDKSVVKKVLEKYDKEDPTLQPEPITNPINRSGDNYQNKVGDILLISRYEGAKVCRILDWEGIVQEFTNKVLDDDPLDFAMDIEVPKQPYAFSLLDFINGITHAKDLLLNQIVDYGSKALNPPLFVDSTVASNVMSRNTLKNAWKLGGLVFADPKLVEHKSMPPLPNTGFELLNYLQTRAEQASGVGAYLGGVPNQVSDKTQGTASGIQTMMQAAVSPVKDRQLNLEESIIEPMINKWLKYAGYLMGKNEIKYVLVTGQNQKWVKLTKGILTGKATLDDLLIGEFITIEQARELATIMISTGKNPEQELVFDIDWIVRVETGSMAEVDLQKELENIDKGVEMGVQHGLQLDLKKIWIERMMKAGLKEPESYLMEVSNEIGGQGIGGAGGAVQNAQGVGGNAGVPTMAGVMGQAGARGMQAGSPAMSGIR